MTQPLSLAGPTEDDKRRNAELLLALKYSPAVSPSRQSDRALTVLLLLSRACGLYESEREGAQREGVLRKLAAILQEYAVHEGLASMDEAEAARRLVQLRTFGSYRLGAHSPDADIDAYAAAPDAKARRGRD